MMQQGKLLTNGMEGRLRYLRTIQSSVASTDEPIIWECEVCAIPGLSIRPPRVVYLGSNESCSTRRVYLIRIVEYLGKGIAMEKVNVNSVSLGKVWEVAVPCRKNRRERRVHT